VIRDESAKLVCTAQQASSSELEDTGAAELVICECLLHPVKSEEARVTEKNTKAIFFILFITKNITP
jgi:hypothetical protein